MALSNSLHKILFYKVSDHDTKHLKDKELASIVLQSISHPLRMTIMEKLGNQPESFSVVMSQCGLEPRHSSGLFNYHLTELINCEVVQKDGEVYRLTDFGFSILGALKKVELECSSFLMKKEVMIVSKEVKDMKEVEITKPAGEQLSAYDFFTTKPGNYAIYRIKDGYMALDCKVEAVLQHTQKDAILMTITSIGDPSSQFCDSSIHYRVHQGKIVYDMGCPIGNQGWFWLLLSLPLAFRDGDTWQLDQKQYRISWIGDMKIGTKTYADCVKIHVDNTKEEEVPFIRGDGVIYLSKGIGMIKYVFSRSSFGGDFSAEIVEHGLLERRNISGRLMIVGETPAVGYRVGVTGCGREGSIAVNTDSQGRFSIDVFGHTIVLRYGSLQTKDDFTFIVDEMVHKIENVTGNIANLVIKFHEGKNEGVSYQ